MAQKSATKPFPVEEFLQALTSQLDLAQDSLALKVSSGRRPLTWALKDLSIDLRVFIEVNDAGKVLLRTAGPNEEGASTVHLNLTSITKPMVEENSWTIDADNDPRSIEELSTFAEMPEEDRRKLDRIGVRTVGDFKQLDPLAVQAIMGIPVARLHAALAASARPAVSGQEVVERPDGTVLLRIHGANLSDASKPEVRLAGEPVEVLESSPRQILVRPLEHKGEGQLEVFTRGQRVTGWFRVPGKANGAAAPVGVSHSGGGK